MKIRASIPDSGPPRHNEEKPFGFGLIAGVIITILIFFVLGFFTGR